MAECNKGYIAISRRELFNVWNSQTTLADKNTAVFNFVCEKLKIHDVEGRSDEHVQNIKVILKSFTAKVNTKWSNHSRVLKRFLSNENEWLEADLLFPDPHVVSDTKPDSKLGRPIKDFEDLSRWAKRRRVAPLVESATVEELTFAASSSLYISGRKDAASVVRNIYDPKAVVAVKNAMKTPSAGPIKYTPEEALSLFIDGRFTKHSYSLMASGAKLHGANIYPPYKDITKAKTSCYPRQETITLSESCAEVTLQGLVDHTAERLIISMVDEITTIESPNVELNLTLKWGCDGSSGHSNYKQRFTYDEQTDSFVFLVCVVPLELRQIKDDVIVWHNPRPCSTRLCRPMKIILTQETKELVTQEVGLVMDQIAGLSPTVVSLNGKVFTISFNFHLTMIDGKNFSAITDSSTQSCGICGAKPSEMNNLKEIKTRKPDATRYVYGLSTLHAYIRCFELLLHVSYRLNVKKWQVRDPKEKEITKERKKHIQDELRTQMGLLVDVPKPGYGTTNDGNTARRFFTQHELASKITGIDEKLIKRFGVLLKALSGGYELDSKAFESYAMDIAKLFVELYPWYCMPASVHRILIHGADVIEAATLPIGMFSEEALEARNKDLRRFREHNTRKKSRICQIEDLFHALLFSSDPLISSISFKQAGTKKHKKSVFDDEVKKLLKVQSRDLSSEESDSD